MSSKIRDQYLAFGKPNFSDLEIEAITRVVKSGWVGMGPETLAFEQELGNYVGAPHVVAVNSCTSALFLSLLVLGVRPGDEVICPSFTWCATANAALYLGAKPVFCEVDTHTHCVTPETVLAKVTPRTRAVIVVHFGGLAIDVHALRARLPASIAIVEDAAHALGARFHNGKPVGTSGNLTCFSFYANKNLSTGDGGAVALFDLELAERLQSLRQNALPINAWKRFTHAKTLLLSNALTELGYKMNYTDLQACIGRVQLSRQREFDAIRLEIAKHYKAALSNIAPPLGFQARCTDPYHARHLFTIRIPMNGSKVDRDELLNALRARNIGASYHYAPLHTMPLYCGSNAPPSLPLTEQLGKSIMTLPISASMTLEDAEYVAVELKRLLN